MAHCLFHPFWIYIIYNNVAQQDIHYNNNLFEYQEVTRIVGELTTVMLITLQAEICDNTQSVQTILGRGSHGHLSLVCTWEAYLALTPGVTQYVQPENQQIVLAVEPKYLWALLL